METKAIDDLVRQHDEDCKSAIAAFQRDLMKVRTGRASTGMIESIHVDYYGAKTALSHLAQVSTPESKIIMVQVYDGGAVSAIEKAIMESGLGFNPSREGNTIRIIVPPLSEERRRDIVKHLHKMAEEMRVSIRNHRRDANDRIKALEKSGAANKDDSKRGIDKVQKQTDQKIVEIDSMLKHKEQECMEV